MKLIWDQLCGLLLIIKHQHFAQFCVMWLGGMMAPYPGGHLSSFLSLILLKMETVQARNHTVILGQLCLCKIDRVAKRDTLC